MPVRDHAVPCVRPWAQAWDYIGASWKAEQCCGVCGVEALAHGRLLGGGAVHTGGRGLVAPAPLSG